MSRAGPGDHAFAAAVVADAGALLLRIRDEAQGTAADRAANDLLLEHLARAFPHDAVLSEESDDDARRLQADRVWIIDPLDGTREYTEPGRTDWAVHVALVVDGIPVAGAVCLPALGETVSTTTPVPEPPRRSSGPTRLVLSRTRRPARILDLAARLDAEVLELGSAGAKAVAVLRGDADVYAHDGGLHEWDAAAPVAVARAAGLHTSRLDGAPLHFNQMPPVIPDLLLCRAGLADQVLDALAH